MVHNQLLLFYYFIFWLHIQHNRRRFPTNYHAIFDNNFFLDATAVVHNQLFLFNIFFFNNFLFNNFLVLYIQHNRRRLPTNNHIILNHHQLILDTSTMVHNQLHDFVSIHLQHDRRCFPAYHDALNHQLVVLSDLDHEHVLHERLRSQVCRPDRQLRQLLWRVLRRVPWQADANVYADGHVHSAFGAEWILEVLRVSGGEIFEAELRMKTILAIVTT